MAEFEAKKIGTGLNSYEGQLPYEPREALNQKMRQDYVSFLINTLRRVSETKASEDFVTLPLVLHENFGIADALTEARYMGSFALGSGNTLHYYDGAYNGKAIEFGVEETKTETEEVELVAWGVRRYTHKEKAPSAVVGRLEMIGGETVTISFRDELEEIRNVGGVALLEAA